MQLQMKGRNVELTAALRSYAEGKLRRLERQLDDPRIELELQVEKNPSIPDGHEVEGTIFTKGPDLRAHAAGRTFEAAIDELVDKLERQVVRYRERRQRKPAHKTPGKVAEPAVEPEALEL